MKPPALALPFHLRSLASLLRPCCQPAWAGQSPRFSSQFVDFGRDVSPSHRRWDRCNGVLFGPVLAQATDTIIINGNGCQVTEEDTSGLFLHSDLYLRIDFPDSHWRFGLRNQGLKGLSLVDVAIQAAQFTSKQYIIKHAGMTESSFPTTTERIVLGLERLQPYGSD